MKFINIEVGKSLNPNSGEEWYKTNALVSLEDGEVPEEVFAALKERIDSWLPNPYKTTAVPLVKKTNEKSKEDTISAHIKTINECNTLNNLNIFKLMVDREGSPGLTAAFNEKKASLELLIKNKQQ